MKNVAILTDNPHLCEESMYLSELKKLLKRKKKWVDVFVLNGPNSLLESKLCLMRTMGAFTLRKKLEEYDIIHVMFTFPLGFVQSLMKKFKLLSNRVIIHTHGYDVFTVSEISYGLRRTFLGDILTRQAWIMASKVITVCKEAAEEVAQKGVSWNNIAVLYNGVNHVLFQEQKKESVEPNRFVFLNVASFVPVKNHSNLLKAFREVRKRHEGEIDINLLLVGNGPTRKMIENLAPDGVFFCGAIEHAKLPNVYSGSDAFILPSMSEAHPWSLLEAMSCGIPCIASSVGGIPETIQNEAFLVEPWSIKSIIEKMMLLIELSPEERVHLGRTNRKIILKNFTMKRHVDTLLQIYKTTLN